MSNQEIFLELNKINNKPNAYAYYTTPELWCDPYIATQMLLLHLNPDIELASRKKEFINRSLEWIIGYFSINNNSHLCDFGCGPGLYTSKFAQKGAVVTGIDFSSNSIEYARKQASENNLEIDYLIQDYMEFETDKKFDLITMIYCDFCALNPKQRSLLLKKFYALLKDTGFLLIDVNSIARYQSREECSDYEYSKSDGFWSPDPYYVFHNCFKYEKEYLLLDKFTIVNSIGKKQSYNWAKCYTLQELSEEFRNSGLQIVEHFANVAGDAYSDESMEIAVIAKKMA